MNKLISIILPVYNVERYIKKCIQSILGQTYSNFELLVINDGALDDSMKIVNEFNDLRINIYNKENGGISDARNFGLQKAKGEFIYFVDSDDWIEPNLLEVCIKSIEKYNSNLIIFGYKLDREDIDNNLISSSIVTHKNEVFKKSQKNITIDDHTLSLMGFVWNKFYRFSFIKQNQLKFDTNKYIFEDVFFNLFIYKQVDTIIFINEVLYHYIDRPVITLTKNFKDDLFEQSITLNNSIYDFLKAWELNRQEINIILGNHIVKSIRFNLYILFTFDNNLNFYLKLKYIKKMLHHSIIKKYVLYYQPKSIKDTIFKVFIKNKMSLKLYLISKILK